jgi:hypothetical protein
MTPKTIPAGVIFLTMTVVQREKSLEIDVWGHGKEYRAYAVQQWEIEGSTNDPYAGAWKKLFRQIKAIDGTWYDAGGCPFRVSIIGIAGGGAATETGRSDVIYRFAERWSPLAYPVKEFALLKAQRRENPDDSGFRKFRIAKIGPYGENTIEIDGTFYRLSVENRLKIDAGRPGAVQRPDGFSDRALYLHYALADVWLDARVRLIGGDLRTALDYLERTHGAHAGHVADKKETRGLTKDFTLTSVVDFLESSGFHVREAREVKKTANPFPSDDGKRPEPAVEAIQLEIAPKMEVRG